MGNKDHMDRILNSTVEEWNKWRAANLRVQPDLTRIDLSGRDLRGINLLGVGLFKAQLSRADLREANLRQSIAIEADFSQANLTGAHVYGISAWDGVTEGSIQNDLVITKPSDPNIITIDDLKIAQFIHMMLDNKNIRDAISSIANKAVLILGRFTDGHKQVLDTLRTKLREHNYLPIMFDFGVPGNRGITETVSILALLSKHIIVDLTEARSAPQELTFIGQLKSVTILPIIRQGNRPYSMFEQHVEPGRVHDIMEYVDAQYIADHFNERILQPLETLSAYKPVFNPNIVKAT